MIHAMVRIDDVAISTIDGIATKSAAVAGVRSSRVNARVGITDVGEEYLQQPDARNNQGGAPV